MEINHISDLLPAVDGRPDFVIADKGDYTVIDYVYQGPDSFDDPRRLECRGIKFARNGEIMARPFRKFFNLGEKQQPHEIDLGRAHVVLEKLDGSMIHPAILNGELVLMTRMGVTDHANLAARRFLPLGRYADFMRWMLDLDYTPLFEFTAPDNRIVVPYMESALTLLGARHLRTGANVPLGDLEEMARPFSVPVVRRYTGAAALDMLVEHTRALQGVEGYVVRFEDDGHAIKIKADEYVMRHRAKSDLDSRRKVIDVILASGQDDLALVLDESDGAELLEFADQVNREIDSLAASVQRVIDEATGVDRKTFAVERVGVLPRALQGVAFSMLDGKCSAREGVVTAAGKHNELLRAEWRGMAA